AHRSPLPRRGRIRTPARRPLPDPGALGHRLAASEHQGAHARRRRAGRPLEDHRPRSGKAAGIAGRQPDAAVLARNRQGGATMSNNSALVISAHSADFVWRCGGAIALHQKRGFDVTIVCLSYGERGESAKLWKNEGATLQSVKDARRGEAE